jgi:hypothetical protein
MLHPVPAPAGRIERIDLVAPDRVAGALLDLVTGARRSGGQDRAPDSPASERPAKLFQLNALAAEQGAEALDHHRDVAWSGKLVGGVACGHGGSSFAGLARL